ncbi:hypothetical protein H312_01573 [Anncaliia algerae PRA339]|uniref:ISXO2-like transposase domain-containing protein n=1 Tax=Anncaliia algerae PRA339 TaxID=1288291 RepID=A0A059F239_9MICR|nr:hypothetical protein H312_01573 [Anncaliia algerae PRA339]
MKLASRRTADECCNFIKQNVNKGNMIYTDEWRGYNLLEKNNFLHKTVKHKIEFISSDDPLVHTQNIESRWKILKEYIPSVNTFELIEKNLKKFVYEKNFSLKTAELKFHFYINLIKISD